MQTVLGRDFSNLWVAGKLALSGQTWAIFNPDTFRVALHEYLGVVSLQNYSYPPHALFIAAPFGLLNYFTALALWTLLGTWFFVRCAKPYLPEAFPPVLSVLTPAATLNTWNGHYGFLLGGLWLICFRNLHRAPARSGLAAGILTFKPHMGLFIAVAVLTKRKALLVAALTTLALIVASAILFGGWPDFLMRTTAEQAGILSRTRGEFYFRMMPSAYVAFGRGVSGVVAQTTVALAAIWMLAKSRKVEPFAMATATFVIVPYVFNYDMTVACLGFAMTLFSRWGELGIAERAGFSLAFLTPALNYVAPWPVPLILLYALALQLEVRNFDSERYDLA